MANMVGRTISHYRILEKIGEGGMGAVYKAQDSKLDRIVALKFLPKHLVTQQSERERFYNEARAVSALNHPSITVIHDIDEFKGEVFMVMEYVEGKTLRQALKEETFPISKVLEIAIQICDGLVAAKEKGIIHRDIKSDNIMLTPNNQVKIMDFGLAKFKGAAHMTATGTTLGTAAYMSPEQAVGEEVDHRSDIFSFGVVLYELLTGRLPFTGEHQASVIYSILNEEPQPIARFNNRVSAKLEDIVAKTLAKDKEERYQNIEDLRSDLRREKKTFDFMKSGTVIQAAESKDYAKSARQLSIAVLPFANMSADKDQEYFCEGMAEDIINDLTHIRGLRVAARISAFAFKDKHEDIHVIGSKLNVETLLEGSVRKEGDRLRITAQLLNVADGYHIWSERYDRELKDVFAIQEEIARSIVQALRIKLNEREKWVLGKVETKDVEAYDYYLRGRQFFHQGRRKSIQFARQMFAKATEMDPNYALAYVGIADCCAMLVHFYGESSDIHLAEADQASSRALELDLELAQAHAARGFTLWLMDQFDKATVEFETAIQMNPDEAETRYLYGRACFQRGNLAQAARLFEEACRGRDYYEARYFAAQTHTALGNAGAALAAYRLALEEIQRHLELNPDDARALTMGAVSLCRLGEKKAGLELAEMAIAIDPADAGIQYNVACLFALEGQYARAIQCLEAAAMAGFAHREWVDKDPDLDSLREDPRFRALKWRE